MMKNLKQLLLAAVFVAAVSMTVSAQKEGDKKTPPKDKPPVIVVEPKKPKDEKPKGDKKPQAMILKNRNETNFA